MLLVISVHSHGHEPKKVGAEVADSKTTPVSTTNSKDSVKGADDKPFKIIQKQRRG